MALEDYTHFTSPIRRYPDLVVHRALKRLIGVTQGSDTKYEEEGYFHTVGVECSERERRAMEAERFVVRRKQCWYLSKHLGETFRGIISGVSQKGVFVEITELVADGFLPLELMDGHYEFDERRLVFVSPSGTYHSFPGRCDRDSSSSSQYRRQRSHFFTNKR